MAELVLLTPGKVSKIVVLADLCTCFSVSLTGKSTSVGGGCGSLPTPGSGVVRPMVGGNWSSKELVCQAQHQQSSLKVFQ